MIKQVFKWIGIVTGGLIVAALISYAFIANSISERVKKQYAFTPEYIDIPTDSATISRGKHLVAIKGCIECHGTRMEGKLLANDFAIGCISGSNLTKGKGGLPETYSTQDWLMALRHGVTRDGRALLLMPSHEYTVLSEGDLAAVIAYCQQLDKVDNVLPPNKVGAVAKVMAFADKMPLLPVEKITHGTPMLKAADTTEGVPMGRYLAVACSGCHRPDMKGGEPLAPGQPQVPNITASGNPGKWTKSQFMQVLRTGNTPGGKTLNNDDMPWKMTAQYSDKELASLYRYLQTLK